MDDATREVLTRARDLIANVGWCQETMRMNDEHGNVVAYCARGAVYAADETERECYAPAAFNALRIAAGIPSGVGIAQVNDAPDTTRETVLGWFDKALEEA